MKKISVIKIGGNILDSERDLSAFLDQFASLEGHKVLVHGGGKAATRQAEALGVPVMMVDGRRITDKAMIGIAVQVYAGSINKGLVADLQSRNCNALGMTGADLNMIPAWKRKHPTIDFGYVGDFDTDSINGSLLKEIINLDVVPVFCALTHDGNGNLLNTNADTIASGLAVALSKFYQTSLYFGFEKDGVLSDPSNDDSVIERLDYDLYQNLKENHSIHDGMIPKLDNAFNALKSGVDKIRIGHALKLSDFNGTELYL